MVNHALLSNFALKLVEFFFLDEIDSQIDASSFFKTALEICNYFFTWQIMQTTKLMMESACTYI